MVRLIQTIEPLRGLLPEVTPIPKGENKGLKDKLFWTGCALLVYLVCSQIPLYGISVKSSTDAFYIMRMILASNKNTLMELGISPIITAGMIMQLLQGARILDVDMRNSSDRQLFNAANKLLAILITIGEAVAYVLAGNYGPVGELGSFRAVAIMLQLIASGFLVMLLDDLLAKGYGLGGGINLFIVTNICEGVVWGAFSPMTLATSGNAMQFEGAVINAVYMLFSERNPLVALYKGFFRADLPNLSNLIATVVVFLLVIYVQGFAYKKLRIQPKQVAGMARGDQKLRQQPYGIKLFYTSNMPIILLTALISQVYFFSQLLFTRYGKNPFIQLLGTWATVNGRSKPVGGLSYILSPPAGLTELVTEPFHSLIYISFMLTACALFAVMWVDISGSGPSDVLAQFDSNGVELMHVPGFKDPKKALKAKIKTAAALGGMCVAALSIFADLAGAIGSGTGILLAVTIIYDLMEKAAEEERKEGMKEGGAGWLQNALRAAAGK